MPRLPSVFTETFARLYEDLPARDVPDVDEMLDRLEENHAKAEMRTIINLGAHSVFATPRVYAPGGVYRITWIYDDRGTPTAITCVTVASIETR